MRSKTTLTCALLAVLSAVLLTSTDGQAGEPVFRTFMFYAGVTGELNFPDVLNENSVGLRIPKEGGPADSLQFINSEDWPDIFGGHPGQPDYLEGSVWVRRNIAHTVKGDKKHQHSAFWLIDENTPELPPHGASTLTGPDGFILSVEILQISQCVAGSCGDSNLNGRWYTSDHLSTGRFFVVVTALFSK